MKILLIQPMPYFWHGGAHKANRFSLERLAVQGHRCRAVSVGVDTDNPELRAAFLSLLGRRGIQATVFSSGTVFNHNGVEVYAAKDRMCVCAEGVNQIREFDPDISLVTEDAECFVVEAALEVARKRVIYLAHSSLNLPFGPDSRLQDAAKTRVLQRAGGVLAVSKYLRDYITQWGGIDADMSYLPAYGDGPFTRLGRYDQGYVTIINPSEIKGIAIFLAMARRMPDFEFAAVPTWATTSKDMDELKSAGNVQILKPVDDIEEILSKSRVLMVPSLVSEAFPAVVIEAMARAIPVVASNLGGLPEAKLGVDYLLPVRRIQHNQEGQAVVPEQDVEVWEKSLTELLEDKASYERVSAQSQMAAQEFISKIEVKHLESYLEAKALAAGETPTVEEQRSPGVSEVLSRLSPKRRALLARRLTEKARFKPVETECL